MENDDTLTWSVKHIPLFTFMAREGGRFLKWMFAILVAACLVVGITLAVAQGDPGFVGIMLMIAAGMCFFTVAASLLVMLAMQAAGCGYSYRLDGFGLSYRFCPTRSRPPAEEIPDDAPDAPGISSEPFWGWVHWLWMRNHGYKMTADEKNGLIALRTETGRAENGEKIPAVYLFCGDGEQFAKVRRFIDDKMG